MPGPAVTLPELLSLAVAREFLAPLAGTCYWRGIGRLVQRIESVATPALLEHVEAHREGLVIHPRHAAGKYPVRLLNAVNRAIRRAQELVIRYRGAADEKPRRVTVRPEALVLYEGSLYLAARKAPARGAADDGPRFYKLDRCLAARPGEATFTPPEVRVEALLEDSVTIYRSPRPPRRFRSRVGPARALWACEKPFHPRQRVTPQPDGGVILDIDRGFEEELVPRILGLGEGVELLEPADVREQIRAAAEGIAARHGAAAAPVRRTR
jgi:predicted DNA-binding transcriptional regulator YafY